MCHNWNDFCLILVEDGFWFIFLSAQKILPEVPVGPAQDVATQGRPEGFLGAFFLRVAKFSMLQTWVWVNTYRYIFSGMNIHLPAILMFTRGTRFWHTATCKIIPNWLKSFRCDIVKYCQGLFWIFTAILFGWWWLEHEWIMTFHILGMPSSQLTNFIIFQRGRYNHQPELVMINGKTNGLEYPYFRKPPYVYAAISEVSNISMYLGLLYRSLWHICIIDD